MLQQAMTGQGPHADAGGQAAPGACTTCSRPATASRSSSAWSPTGSGRSSAATGRAGAGRPRLRDQHRPRQGARDADPAGAVTAAQARRRGARGDVRTAGLPFSRIATPWDLLEDPHLLAGGVLRPHPPRRRHPRGAGAADAVRRRPPRAAHALPKVGEHMTRSSVRSGNEGDATLRRREGHFRSSLCYAEG